ncbi:MAG: DUF805 domain-containing protein [Bacteroidales bacterium]
MNYYIKVLKNYVNFTGRARRKEFWMFVLFSFIISIIIYIIEQLIGSASGPESGPIYGIYNLAVFLPSLAVAIRRMHDVGKSGWFILIPIYNLILCCTEGNEGSNKYGEDPKGGSSFEVDEIGKSN